MAEQRRGDHGGLTGAAAAAHRDEQQHHNTMNSPEEAGAIEALSLEEILRLYSQPINEEQAWAVCYQCCRTLAKEHRDRRSSSAAAGASSAASMRISGAGDVRIQKDGSVRVDHQGCEGKLLYKTGRADLGQAITCISNRGVVIQCVKYLNTAGHVQAIIPNWNSLEYHRAILA